MNIALKSSQEGALFRFENCYGVLEAISGCRIEMYVAGGLACNWCKCLGGYTISKRLEMHPLISLVDTAIEFRWRGGI